ncbi:MAG: glutathione S-transferase N-terminal domain-containing protein [Halioglobus sp.]
MNKPILYIFAISHYCEKARWALDYLEIDHQIRYLSPGMHIDVAKNLGVPASSLPILADTNEVIQGSAEIIDWAQKNTATQHSLTPPDKETQCLDFEQRLDNVAGVHTRRYFYSEALVENSNMVLQTFTKDLQPAERESVTKEWPMIREMMIQMMDLGAAQGEESKQIVNRELAWIDELLADGRSYLVADRFSRVDIAAASLFARQAAPEGHPSGRFMELPPRMAATQKSWHNRPSLQWIRGIYRKHRKKL